MWRRFGHDCARPHRRAGTDGCVDRHLFGVRPGGSNNHDDRTRTGNRIEHGRDTHDDGATYHDRYASRINLHRKDLNNALITGQQLGVSLPVTALVQQMIVSLVNSGEGDSDHSAIAKFLEDMAGIKISGD